jgi:hypothetical protein
MGNNIYTNYWEENLPNIFNQIKNDKSEIELDISGLKELSNRKFESTTYEIQCGKLLTKKNIHAYNRDLTEVLISSSFYQDTLFDQLITISAFKGNIPVLNFKVTELKTNQQLYKLIERQNLSQGLIEAFELLVSCFDSNPNFQVQFNPELQGKISIKIKRIDDEYNRILSKSTPFTIVVNKSNLAIYIKDNYLAFKPDILRTKYEISVNDQAKEIRVIINNKEEAKSLIIYLSEIMENKTIINKPSSSNKLKLDLIERYKNLIKTKGLEAEKYKWELIKENFGRPKIEKDIEEEISSINFGNVIYHLAVACLKVIVKKFDYELKIAFEQLRDESKDLNSRIEKFYEDTFEYYKAADGKNSHHQDERSMSVYLTYTNPEKYTFYKSSYYQLYCKFLGVMPKKPKEKYSHYLELVRDLSENYIEKDQELISLVNDELGELTSYDQKHLLIAQDIIYQVVSSERDINYWVFQGNPKVFDFETALKQEILTDWTVSAHKDKINIGDKVILWITGTKAGCYALAEVTAEPHEKKSSPDDHLWLGEDKRELKADIQITHNLIDSPIRKEIIDASEKLKNLKTGNQGTNFTATKEQYDALLELAENQDSFENIKNKLDPQLFKGYIDALIKMITHLGLQPSDKRVVFSVTDKGLNFIIGQRYCCNLYIHHNKGEFAIISNKKLNETSSSFDGLGPEAYYNHFSDFKLDPSEWKSITQAIEAEYNRTEKSSFLKHNNIEFENYVYEHLDNSSKKNQIMKTPLNRILYGPPGTGKTYHTINEALNIISPEFLNENKEDREVLNDKYRKLVEQGQIVFTTFHQSMTYEDFVEGIKPQEPNSPGDPISYIIEPGIFKRVCSKAMMKSENNFDTAYNAFLEEISNHADEKFKLNTKTGKVFAVSINSKNNLTLFTGSELKPNGTLTKENIQNQLINGESYDYWDSYFKGVINYLVERHNYVEKQTQSVKKYVLIIDEINRGNVSQIFGELITLLEDDKRLGEDESQRVKLPYSKEMFGVPSNLYLIGTMNTADRSVEALDSALRRRFSFVEMPPIPIILNTHSIVKDGIIDGFDLKILLSTINQRIEKILDKDHLIGHSYFLKVSSISELKFVFQQNIIPLLQEYFYGDYGKIGLVLGSGFVEKQEWENEGDLFADFDYDSSSLNDRPIYIIKDVQTMPDDDFKTSLNLLMNKE